MTSYIHFIQTNPIAVFGIAAAMAIICFGCALAVGSIFREVVRKR